MMVISAEQSLNEAVQEKQQHWIQKLKLHVSASRHDP